MDQPESEAGNIKYGPKVIDPNIPRKALNWLDQHQDEYDGCYQ